MFASRCTRDHAIAVVFLIFGITGTSARAPSRIVSGSDALPGEFPYQVSIRVYDKHICGGAIIGKRHVLTAAHCIDGITEAPYSEMTIVTGSNTLEPATGKAYRVKNVTLHQQYVAFNKYTVVQNDIAVISLRKEIEENKYQKAIALPSEPVPNGVQGIVSGFGRTDHQGIISTTLKKLIVTILGSAECFANGIRIQRYQLCAHNGVGFGTCKGDSGGPLVYNGAIVGVISMSPTKCGSGLPDIYTRVYIYKDFINNAIANT